MNKPSNWSSRMNSMEYILIFTLIYPIVAMAAGADECRTSSLICYDCDSRHDPFCDDPFNKSISTEHQPATKQCQGCCVKFVHKFSYGEWVQRSCTENLQINYFMVDHVCMGEGKGHGKMCFCEDNLCNGTPTKTNFNLGFKSLLIWTGLLYSLMTLHVN